jgi:hypothetical protein
LSRFKLASIIFQVPLVLHAEQAAKARQQLSSFVANEQNGASAVSFTSDERSFIIDMGASITIYQMTF